MSKSWPDHNGDAVDGEGEDFTIEDVLNTIISSPTQGWYEVFQNTGTEHDEPIHLAGLEHFTVDRFVGEDELRRMMANGWSIQCTTTTVDPDDSDEGGESA